MRGGLVPQNSKGNLRDVTPDRNGRRTPLSRKHGQGLVQFPVTEELPDSLLLCPPALRPISKRNVSLAAPHSPVSREHVSTSSSSPLRSALDRRTSLPVLGIDLGRSGPSYGHTLKRSTVAVYGMAMEVFDLVTETPAPRGVSGLQTSSGSPLAATNLAAQKCLSTVLNSSQRALDFRKQPHDELSESSKENASPIFASTSPFNRHNTTCYFGKSAPGEIVPENAHLSEPTSNSTSRPPLSTRSQTVGRLNTQNLRRRTNLFSPGSNVTIKTHLRRKTAENFKGVDLLLLKTEEMIPFDLENDQDLSGREGNLASLQETLLDRLRRVRQKRLIVRELIETERRYLAILEKIDQHYLQPIRQSQRRDDIANNPRNSRYSTAFVRTTNTVSPSILPSTPPMSNIFQKEILPIATTIDIFSNFTPILNLAREFLSVLEDIGTKSRLFDPDLEHTPCLNSTDNETHKQMTAERDAKILATSEELMVGKILSRLWPFFKLYTFFTANFAVSQSKLYSHSARSSPSPEFVKLLSDCSRRGVDEGLGLPHMLLTIIQRVPRYELLIKDLIKNSSERFDPDYPHLLTSKRMLSYVARRLEAAMKDQEERTKILDIQRSMEGLNFPLVNPTRKLVKVGLLHKLGRKGDRRKRIFFLFNDCLIYAGLLSYSSQENMDTWIRWLTVKASSTHTTNSHSYSIPIQAAIKSTPSLLGSFGYSEENRTRLVFCLKMDLKDVNVVGTASGMDADRNSFQVLSSAKSFVVYAESSEVKGEWITALRQAKHDMLDNRGTLYLTEENTHNQLQRRPRPNHRHSYTSSPPLRIVSWVSLTSSDGTGSSFPADGTEPRFNSPTDSSQGGGPDGTRKTVNESRTVYSSPVTTSPPFNNITASMISFLNLKALVNRGIFTSGFSELDSVDAQFQASSGAGTLNRSKAQNHHDPKFLFVAENYSAPVWVPDNKASRCMACQERFNLLKRRHHCRLCGCVFCANCSCRNFIIAHPEEGDRYARACEACYQSVFLVPQRMSATDDKQRMAHDLVWLQNRPHDDLDLAVHEQRQRQAYATHRHRSSLPLALDASVCNQLRELETDPRCSLFSAITVGEDVAIPMDQQPNRKPEPSHQVATKTSFPLEGSQTQAGKQLNRLLQKNPQPGIFKSSPT